MRLILLFVITFLYACKTPSLEKIDYDLKDYRLNSEMANLLKSTKDGGLVATRYAFVSEYQKLIEARDVKADSVDAITDTAWMEIQKNYRIENATNYILNKATDHDFLMINEAHFIPLHRHFLRRLLPGLSKLGYKYLALEAIGMMQDGEQYDKEIEERGYPTIRTGFYTKEPEFGQLIREAVDLGFEIIGYDQGSGEEREKTGAKNILRKLDEFGNEGKTIVLCGWDHIKETHTGTYWEYALAGRIKEYTGKDPLTINQTQYYERSLTVYEDSIYQRMDNKKPIVFIDEQGRSIDRMKDTSWYDLFVFHPRTKYIEGIPDWIVKERPIQTVSLPEIDIQCPCKVLLFEKEDDPLLAVPLFVKELERIEKKLRLPMTNKEVQILISNGVEGYLVEW